MYTPNSKWSKWILISAIKHFKEMADANSIHFHISDTHSDNPNRFIEFRMDGPIITQLSRNYFRFLVGINVLFSTDIEDNYLDDTILAGLIQEAFSEICVYKYNDGGAFLETLLPGELTVNDFGTVKDTKIKQGSVEAIFEIYLEN